MTNIPDGFEPLIMIGVVNDDLMLFTNQSSDATIDLLEQTLEFVVDGDEVVGGTTTLQ
jgi:hypothetical protein